MRSRDVSTNECKATFSRINSNMVFKDLKQCRLGMELGVAGTDIFVGALRELALMKKLESLHEAEGQSWLKRNAIKNFQHRPLKYVNMAGTVSKTFAGPSSGEHQQMGLYL